MAFSITNLGIASSASTMTTVPLTIGAGGVPVNAIISIGIVDTGNVVVTSGSIADSRGNTYNHITGRSLNNLQSNGYAAARYAVVATALQQNDTITYTKSSSIAGGIAACYITGVGVVSPVDSAVTASAGGSNPTPIVTSVAPTGGVSTCMIGLAGLGSALAMTQDAAWTNVPGTWSTDVAISAANKIATAAQTYAPVVSMSAPWAAIIVGFKPGSDLAAAALAAGSPVLGTPALLPISNFAAAALAAGPPVIASPTLSAISNLTAATLAAGSPLFTPAQSSGQKHVLTAAAFVAGSPDIGTSQLWQTPPPLVVGPPSLPAPALAQRQALAAVSLTAAAPVLDAPAFQGVAPLAAVGLSVGPPALGAPAFLATSQTGAASVTAGAPVLGAPQLWLTPPSLAVGWPALEAPDIGQRHAFAALPLAVQPPREGAVILSQTGDMAVVPVQIDSLDLGAPALGQRQGIAAASLAVAAPGIGTPAIVPSVPLIAVAVAATAPVLGAPTLAAISHLVDAGLATAEPAIGVPTFQQRAHLVTADLVPDGPDIGTASLAPTSYLTAVSLAPLPPQLGAAILNQRHGLGIPRGVNAGIWTHTPVVYAEKGEIAAVPHEVGSPDIGTPAITNQVHRLSTAFTIESPDIGAPVLQSECHLVAANFDIALMFLPKPKLGQVYELVAASEIIIAIDIGEPYFHFVDHSIRYTVSNPTRKIVGRGASAHWDGGGAKEIAK